MKKIALMVVMAAVVVLAGAPALWAATATQAYTAKAMVDGGLSLDIHLYRGAPGTGPTGSELTTGLDFGKLVEKTFVSGTNTYKELRSDDTGGHGEIIAMVTANSHQLPYTITQTGTSLISGVNKLPDNACVTVGWYATQDNGGATLPAGAVCNQTKGSWVGTRQLYKSESGAAAMRTVQAHFAISGDPDGFAQAQAVPLNQAVGTYTGTVTFTVTA